VRITYDLKARAMYIYITNGKVERSAWINETKTAAVDYDADGNVRGIELLHIEEPQLISYEILSKSVAEPE
jgi:uncharacterized protein YuzE